MKYLLSDNELNEMEAMARRVRRDIIDMLAHAGSGHPGGSLSCVEILVTLYGKIMRHDPAAKVWSDYDHFHLSKGHVCPALYAVLACFEYFHADELKGLRKFGSLLQGHPHGTIPGIEVSSGSLGQGVSIACGMALAGKMDKKDYSVFVLVGDGETQEGQIWEAAMFAAQYKLDNLCMIVDNNGLQIDGRIHEIMSPYSFEEKFKAFGFNVIALKDGHNINEVYNAFKMREEVKGKPTVIIAKTVKGKGVSFMEDNVAFHGRATTPEETAQALQELSE